MGFHKAATITHEDRCTNRLALSAYVCHRLVGHRCSLLCDAILHFCNVCSVKRSADATRPQRDSKGVMLNSFFFFVFAYVSHTHSGCVSTTTTLLSLVMAAQRSKRSHHACYFLTGSCSSTCERVSLRIAVFDLWIFDDSGELVSSIYSTPGPHHGRMRENRDRCSLTLAKNAYWLK